MTRTLFILGTRPEAIKMAPLVLEMQRCPDRFVVEVCSTGQHREMLDQVLHFFGIAPTYELALMTPGQTLFGLTGAAITALEDVMQSSRPDLVIVQGDTTTAMIGALAGYYSKVTVAHLEAGLRSGQKYAPFPEEVNRRMVSHITDLHFAPTEASAENLRAEGISQGIHVVGNTVIDALLMARNRIARDPSVLQDDLGLRLDPSHRLVLVTGHRRESFGEPFRQMCLAMRDIAQQYSDVDIVYPVHLNPQVRMAVHEILDGVPRVHLIEPVDYPHMVWLMDRSFFVLTDSGGIQEEAPALGKPVLIMRDVTERPEGVAAGCAKLVGTNREAIVDAATSLLTDPAAYARMSGARNPYGDGTTSAKIVEVLGRDRVFSRGTP